MKKVEISYRYLLSFSTLYPGEELDCLQELKKLPATPALELISLALHRNNFRKKSEPRFQSTELFSWMMQMDPIEQQAIITFAQNNSQLIGDESFTLLDRQACLDLIQHLLVYGNAEHTILQSTDHSRLFKCLLYFNQKVNTAEQNLFEWDSSGTADQFMDYILPIHSKNIDLNTFRDYKDQFLKVFYFFKFCETDPKFSPYLTKFLQSLKIPSYQHYLWRVLDQTFLLALNDKMSTKVEIEGDKEYMQFFESLAINMHIGTVHPDLLVLKQFPLFKLADNQFLYLDYRLFIDKFYQSFIFDFAAKAQTSIANIKSHMGEYFSESILFYRIMENCFPRYGQIRLSGKELKPLLKEAEPDYYIREGSKIFIFEFKDLMFSWQVKHSGDPSQIKTAIVEKLESTTSGQPKGITQLINNIVRFKNGYYGTRKVDGIDPKNTTVYPILVHTDILLESYGVNRYLNQRFEKLIQQTGFADRRVKPVILINLDTLIHLQDFFASGVLKLATCINAYLEYISAKDPVNANFPFDEYIKHFLGKKIKKMPPATGDFERIISELAQDADNPLGD